MRSMGHRLTARWAASSLFLRMFLLNALVLLGAGAALVLTPAEVSSDAKAEQVLVLLAGLFVLLAVDLVLLRRALRPLTRLVADMRTVDLLVPGRRVPQDGPGHELIELSGAFNDMIDRLERERQVSALASFEAGEAERLRIARELHDQTSQDLTALVMTLERAQRRGRGAGGEDLTDARELTVEILAGVRTIISELRPDPLDELGLAGALRSLCDRAQRTSGIPVQRAFPDDLPAFPGSIPVAVYRVAQEALANAVRHAQATTIAVALDQQDPATWLLTVRDDGRGRDSDREGIGIRGMRERALTIGAELVIIGAPSRGTMVALRFGAVAP